MTGANHGQSQRKRGGRKRAERALLYKPTRTAISAMPEPRLYWSVRLNPEPPSLRTTFGNFSTLNHAWRGGFTTSTSFDRIVFVPWTPSPIAALNILTNGTTATTITQCIFGAYAGGNVPLSVRPLRMSVEILNETQLTSVAGEVQILSIENALQTTGVYGATSTSDFALTNATAASLQNIVATAPETKIYSAHELVKTREVVSVPASWPAYNRYFDFVPFVNYVDGDIPASGDIYALAMAESPLSSAYPYTTATTDNIRGAWGDVPPLRGLLIILKATPTAQTYRIVIRRQDGARYAANTLGHLFHKAAVQGTPASESKMLRSTQIISQSPSVANETTLFDKLAGAWKGVNNFLESPLGGFAGNLGIRAARRYALGNAARVPMLAA